MPLPVDSVLIDQIKEVLLYADLQKTSPKTVRAQVEERLGLTAGFLDVHRSKMKNLIDQEVDRISSLSPTAVHSPPQAEATVASVATPHAPLAAQPPGAAAATADRLKQAPERKAGGGLPCDDRHEAACVTVQQGRPARDAWADSAERARLRSSGCAGW